METLTTDPAWRVCPRFLADLQTVSDTATIGDEAIERAAALLAADPEIISKKRGAAVADREFWKARQFGRSLSEFGTSTVVFKTLEIACSYLGLDKAETRQKIRQLRAKLRARSNGQTMKRSSLSLNGNLISVMRRAWRSYCP